MSSACEHKSIGVIQN